MRPILATDARNHIPDGQDLFGSYSLGARFRSGWGYLDVAEDTEFWDLASCAKLAVEESLGQSSFEYPPSHVAMAPDRGTQEEIDLPSTSPVPC